MVRTANELRDADLVAILDAVPCLRADQGRTLERIDGELTNLNVKVTFADRSRYPVIARICTEDSALLAIDRDAEHANSVAAARAGVAPTVDFDFWTWGMEKYERAVAEFARPDFGRLLEEVTAGA